MRIYILLVLMAALTGLTVSGCGKKNASDTDSGIGVVTVEGVR